MFVSFLVFVTLFEILFAAEPPRRDGGELLLSKDFLDTCSSKYAVCQENQGQPFVSKYFNVIDPLRINNNLGRSVSKGIYIYNILVVIPCAFEVFLDFLTVVLPCLAILCCQYYGCILCWS